MRSPKAKPILTETTSGFTLIEVLLVVLMVGILMGIAAPGWLAFADRQRMNVVRSDLLEALRQAQADARQNRADRKVEILVNSPQPAVQIGSAPSTTLGSGNIRPDYVRLSAEYSTGSAWEAASTVTFDYEGLPEASSVPFVIKVSPHRV
ncbi:MAG: type II secretion system protein [Leptolyngbyaceae cyanobacterium SM1_1_3]|nr:type II secretion system protein [Leptolyngbyaceae cyanobacterium SM1_1_3]